MDTQLVIIFSGLLLGILWILNVIVPSKIDKTEDEEDEIWDRWP